MDKNNNTKKETRFDAFFNGYVGQHYVVYPSTENNTLRVNYVQPSKAEYMRSLNFAQTIRSLLDEGVPPKSIRSVTNQLIKMYAQEVREVSDETVVE